MVVVSLFRKTDDHDVTRAAGGAALHDVKKVAQEQDNILEY